MFQALAALSHNENERARFEEIEKLSAREEAAKKRRELEAAKAKSAEGTKLTQLQRVKEDEKLQSDYLMQQKKVETMAEVQRKKVEERGMFLNEGQKRVFQELLQKVREECIAHREKMEMEQNDANLSQFFKNATEPEPNADEDDEDFTSPSGVPVRGQFSMY